jgi:hypothetical protein
MIWFEATTTLRWVDKDVACVWDDNGHPTAVQRQRVLQQWFVRKDQNIIIASNYADGEWRDVPTETDE